MRTVSRVDYDAIAHLYDGQPHRDKTADPEPRTFLVRRAATSRLSILDIACGTGNQIAANRLLAPDALFVGLDRSLGMLRQAQTKMPHGFWVHADGSVLPFQSESFDFVTCQFAFHHIPDKAGMLRAAFRVLRRDGRLVMRNLCPQAHPDWIYYDYFPEAHALDLEDFWPHETIATTMEAIGFAAVSVELEHLHVEQDLRAWLDTVRRRDTNSQLMAISDRAYDAGLRRLEHELSEQGTPRTRVDHLCLLTVRGDKP